MMRRPRYKRKAVCDSAYDKITEISLTANRTIGQSYNEVKADTFLHICTVIRFIVTTHDVGSVAHAQEQFTNNDDNEQIFFLLSYLLAVSCHPN